jgi:hypothetical protein
MEETLEISRAATFPRFIRDIQHVGRPHILAFSNFSAVAMTLGNS